MIIHGVETKPYGHGKCSFLSNRTDPNNLTTLPFSKCPRPVWTDRYNPHWDGRTNLLMSNLARPCSSRPRQ